MVKDRIPVESLRRALVIKLRHHGDVLLASPVFAVLKNHAPEIEIDALVYADTAPMLTLHPAIGEVHRIDRGWKRAGVITQTAQEWGLLSRLRARRYDLVVHLTEHRRGAWLVKLLGPRYAVAPEDRERNRLWRGCFTHLYGRAGNRHVVEQNLDALRRIGVQPGAGERRLVLVAGEEAEASAARLLEANGLVPGGFVHFHPASRWLFKCWPAGQSAALIDRIQASGIPVVITAADDRDEMALVQAIRAGVHGKIVDLSGKLSLKELAALSARARLFVGVDSAPMHIAAAMGTPVVVLFGPTSEQAWGPWNADSRVVSAGGYPCRPCGQDGCGGGKVSECLTSVSVEEVWQAVSTMLRKSDTRTWRPNSGKSA